MHFPARVRRGFHRRLSRSGLSPGGWPRKRNAEQEQPSHLIRSLACAPSHLESPQSPRKQAPVGPCQPESITNSSGGSDTGIGLSLAFRTIAPSFQTRARSGMPVSGRVFCWQLPESQRVLLLPLLALKVHPPRRSDSCTAPLRASRLIKCRLNTQADVTKAHAPQGSTLKGTFKRHLILDSAAVHPLR